MQTIRDKTRTFEAMAFLFDEIEKVTDDMLDGYNRKSLANVKKGETTVGTVHDVNVRKLKFVINDLAFRAQEIKSKADRNYDEAQSAELNSEAFRLKSMAQLAKEWFWTEMAAVTGVWTGGIGIRKDWMAVKLSEDDSKNPLSDLLSGLLGGGE